MFFIIFIFITGVYLGQEFKQIPSVISSTKYILQRKKSFVSKFIDYVRN